MSHALIIEKNMIIGSELSRRLSNFGFDSFDHVWTEEDAVAVADMRPPDLILVGDNLETGDAVEAARRICEKRDVPVLMVTSDSFRVKQRLSNGAVLDGPFAFSKIPLAIKAAYNRPSQRTSIH
ncbi:hypothetical protein [Parasphingorhabdus sp.]|uniref:hypothetical protein n=1 Tax=Parasphingorhabdus sp. TaxID=2709688 RepID=UPI002F952408